MAQPHTFFGHVFGGKRKVVMKATWLVMDVSFLCHRAWHTTGDLSWKGSATGVVYGFLRTVQDLKDVFLTNRVVFCFDHPHLFRRDIYPAYKQKRNDRQCWTEEESESYRAMRRQLVDLQHNYLPNIGFRNILCADGYESDDLMARVAADCPENEEVILVTSDGDLLQCLQHNVSMFSPIKKMLLTNKHFDAMFHMPPRKYALVKALAGCKTDNVQGIKGIGEKTALRYCRGELPQNTKSYRAIIAGAETVIRNRKLVQLPFEGCPHFSLVDDNISNSNWEKVCRSLGIKSLAGRF